MDNFDILGQGQVSSAGLDGYLVPASKHASIRYIGLIQVAAGTPKIDLFINNNASAIANLWRHVELGGVYDGWEWSGALLLGTGDRVWLKDSGGGTNIVNFVVSGVVGDPV